MKNLSSASRRACRAVFVLTALVAFLPLPASAQSTILKAFAYTEGQGSFSPIVFDADGVLYGATAYGGPNGSGTIFRLNRDGTGFATLHAFQSYYNSNDGYYPYGGVIVGADGRLYGTSSYGGSGQAGTVYRLDRDGANFTVLHSFSGGDGHYVWGGLLEASDGFLYGVAQHSGQNGGGTLFRLRPDGTSFSVVFHFSANSGNGQPSYPMGTLIEAADGRLIGTSNSGGSNYSGTVFAINRDGTGLITLHSFTGSDGSYLQAGVLQAADGTLFGTAHSGGNFGEGVVFRLNADGSGFAVLHHLHYGNPEAGYPYNVVPTLASNGRLYASAYNGGTDGGGSVFSMNPDGSDFVIEQLFGSAEFGTYPLSGIRQGPDGGLYGTTYMGGSNGGGTVFLLGTLIIADTMAPVITVPADLVVEATSPAGATAIFAASATDDVDSAVAVTLSPASGSTFALGTTTVTASAADEAGNAATKTFTVTVQDTTAPVLTVPTDLTVEATSAAGATALFTASATDAVGATVVTSHASGSTFPIGITTVTVTATDAAGNTASGTFTVTVADTTAPVISSLTASATSLWPANHKLVAITLAATTSDLAGAVTTKIISAVSNEADNGLGDGDTANDIALTGPMSLNLRAERAGSGHGRIYTITVEARDAAGNTSTQTVTVSVSKNGK